MKRVLITDWGDGARFFHVWRQALPKKSSEHSASQHSTLTNTVITTHIVALCPEPSAWEALSTNVQKHLPRLHKHWWGLREGFHRFDLGNVQLMLCVGEPLVQLKALNAEFDEVLQAPNSPADRWWFKALAQHCRVGTQLFLLTADDGSASQDEDATKAMREAGFVPTPSAWSYQPSWTPKRRAGSSNTATKNADNSPVLVIGAGLAGSSVAAALARRGHSVTVLDAASAPAAGASGLPVGLMAPLLSRDDNPRSRLIRAGLRLSLQAVSFLREGYGITGLLEKNAATSLAEPRLDDWSQARGPDVWHPHAAWVKPSALVKHWLATPGVRFQGQRQVARLCRHEEMWLAQNDQGQTLAQAPRVVLAHAMQSLALSAEVHQGLASASEDTAGITRLPDDVAQGMRGLVVMGMAEPLTEASSDKLSDMATWPQHPINGNGGFIPQLPTDKGTGWAFGATYEASSSEPLNVSEHVQANQAKLAALLPELAGLIPEHLALGTLQHWQGERCVTQDRFPLLGPLDEAQTLWLCAGLGSRGLSFAALCAEQLAALWHQEPAPLSVDLARCLSLERVYQTK